MHHNHLEGLLKQITGPSPGASDSVGLGWALRTGLTGSQAVLILRVAGLLLEKHRPRPVTPHREQAPSWTQQALSSPLPHKDSLRAVSKRHSCSQGWAVPPLPRPGGMDHFRPVRWKGRSAEGCPGETATG